LIAIDLFSGAGGLSLGLEQAGFSVVAAVEIDSLAVETYGLNHQDTIIWEKDIRHLKISKLKKRLQLCKGNLDLLAGCPPCQGFSSIRTLNGSLDVDDDRNDLIYEFLRFVRALRPKTIMLENVPGLAKDGRMDVFCKQLQEMGYQYDKQIIDTADYGAPQRRRRLVLLASRLGRITPAEPASETRTVQDAISDLPAPGLSGDPLHDFPERRSDRILNLIQQITKDGGGRKDLMPEFHLPCHQKCNGFKDVYGRMAWKDVAPTMTGGCVNPSKGRFLHPTEDRAITLREAALLQTFPPDYRFSLDHGKHRAAAMIGNAFPPETARRYGVKIMEHIQEKAAKRKKRRAQDDRH
jgi:DNA (cytosine-5)-methyltransferase 1